MIIFATAFLSLVVSYIYFDKMQHAGMGPVLGAWLVIVIALAFIFKKQWFAKPGNFIGINLYALTNGGFKAAASEYGEETIDGIKAVWRVLSVFAFIPVFWALWDQSQSEWVVQASKMNLNWLGIEWKAEQISFVIVAIIQGWIDAGETPNISWQILAFVVLTAGEVLISITGLEYAYTQAPPSMKSTIMACWLITVTLGNVLVSVIQTNISNGGFFAQFHGAGFFWLFTGICAATAVLFILVSPLIKEKSYINR